LPLRSRIALGCIAVVNTASRRLGAGSGTVAGGRAGLAIDPTLFARLAAGRVVAVVTGTNGKTTTTRLLSVALGPTVVTNATGSNMPAGHVAALAAGSSGAPAVLEVDEGYLPVVLESAKPRAVVLLNLSRDQLDRTNEVRMLAARWRAALAGADGAVVVANADDPLVVWGAGTATDVVWVAAGSSWLLDASGCPACEGRIDHDAAGSWRCTCGFARPTPDVVVAAGGHEAVWSDGRRLAVDLAIPGRFNRANAVMAAAAAEVLGVTAENALAAMAGVGEVAGRFATRVVGGVKTRLLLAKNPAGWVELLELLEPGSGPVVVGINARVADGRDPSWLWDVAFERLAGRPVVATGERCRDLSVRLRYAGVPHRTVLDPVAAIEVGASLDPAAERVDYAANYTAFFDLEERG